MVVCVCTVGSLVLHFECNSFQGTSLFGLQNQYYSYCRDSVKRSPL